MKWDKKSCVWIDDNFEDPSSLNYVLCYSVFCILSKIRLKKGQQRYLDIELIGKEIIE
jgi:hypothetical protein